MTIDLPAEFSVGLTPQWGLEHDGTGLVATAGLSLALARPIAGPLGAFVEFAANGGLERGDTWAMVGATGLSLGLDMGLTIDAGALIGLNDAAPDLGAYLGVAIAF